MSAESGYGKQTVDGAGVYVDINPVRAVRKPVAATEQDVKGWRVHLPGRSTGPVSKGPYMPYVKTIAGLAYFNYP